MKRLGLSLAAVVLLGASAAAGSASAGWGISYHQEYAPRYYGYYEEPCYHHHHHRHYAPPRYRPYVDHYHYEPRVIHRYYAPPPRASFHFDF